MQKTVSDVWVEYRGYEILFRKGWSEYGHQYIIRIVRPDGSDVDPIKMGFGKGRSIATTDKAVGETARDIVDYDIKPIVCYFDPF